MNEFNNFHITQDQKELIWEHFGQDVTKMQDWEIGELLDQLIEQACI